jgi:SseB protein C-terminal domain
VPTDDYPQDVPGIAGFRLGDRETVVFLGEQDGIPERKLKACLLSVLDSDPEILFAYLAQVEYVAREERSVALCIRTSEGLHDSTISTISRVFAEQFNKHAQLDVLDLNDRQWGQLRVVCAPFYTREA